MEGLNNSAVLTKICMLCRLDRASQAAAGSKKSSPAPSECVVDEKESSILAEIAILNSAVNEISTKLDHFGSVVAEPLAKAVRLIPQRLSIISGPRLNCILLC